jgi:hypothetical protein
MKGTDHHGNLKPNTIVLDGPGSRVCPFISDFGRGHGARGIGTPLYMA